MKSVFNKDKNLDSTKQLMFFGPDLAVQRYDNMKYPIFDKLNQQQLGYFWRPEEVSLQKDRNDYLELRLDVKINFCSSLN
jgi:ribonucleoside-diphosphate reductase beta chain